MKKTKILIPALGILALGMAASVTGTVAWFTQTAIAKATGISVKSTVPSSLYITNGLLATTAGNAFDTDSVNHGSDAEYAAQSSKKLDPIHMDKSETNTLAARKPVAYSEEPNQTSAGTESAWLLDGVDVGDPEDTGRIGALVGTTSAGAPAISGSIDQALYVKESIVRRKTQSENYTLYATVKVSGVHYETKEMAAFNTLRVGFFSTIDDGAHWNFFGQAIQSDPTTNTSNDWQNSDATNNINTAYGRPALTIPNGGAGLTVEDELNGEFVKVPVVGTNAASNNSVLALVVVLWLEGTDDACLANNFQFEYTWNIEISYTLN